MDLQEVMQQKVFVVVGNTINKEKYAYKIKNALIDHGYTTYCVDKELKSINDVDDEIDIIDLCVHPVKGLKFIKENKKAFKMIVIQPNADSKELLAYLDDNNLPYIFGCLLVGLSLYS